ncbi:MAG: TatD family hydrolase [Flavobacteriaceae bacterium]|nr:TatD family hydrolase [Flavobacteriaceae bacterium]
MIITDTHAHLYSEQFDEDRDAMMQRALDAGVSRLFIPAIDKESYDSMIRLEKSYPNNAFLLLGLHPTYVKENFREELDFIAQKLEARSFYGIGEIGIDLYWDRTFLKQQQEAFKTQIQWAKKYKLPVIIHCRDAFDEIFEVLESEKGDDLFGIFHCFTGTLAQAKQAISYNLKLGIGGVATFKNGKIDRFLNEIALKNIVVETDAPYLAPTPYRGKRNEPSYIVKVIEKLATIYQITSQEIAAVTTQNSKDIFGI